MNIKITTTYEVGNEVFKCVTEDERTTANGFVGMTDRHLEKEGAIERQIQTKLLKCQAKE